LLEPENFAMFAIKGLEEFLPPVPQFIPPLKPGAVNAIARSINITSPNALQTHEHVAMITRPHFLELVRESDRRTTADASKRAEGPLVRRPVVAREEDSLATCFHESASQSFEVSFRTAAGGKATTHQSNPELLWHYDDQISRD
jgi:hypothetical protein